MLIYCLNRVHIGSTKVWVVCSRKAPHYYYYFPNLMPCNKELLDNYSSDTRLILSSIRFPTPCCAWRKSLGQNDVKSKRATEELLGKVKNRFWVEKKSKLEPHEEKKLPVCFRTQTTSGIISLSSEDASRYASLLKLLCSTFHPLPATNRESSCVHMTFFQSEGYLIPLWHASNMGIEMKMQISRRWNHHPTPVDE